MKKKFVCFCIFVFATCLFTACSNDDDTENFNNVVEIDENGSTSNGSRYTPIDDKNFYLDYIKYSIENKHIVVTGYDKAGIYGVARIVSSIKYKGEIYDVLRIAEYAFENCNSLTSIRIPNSVTSIEKDAFRGCSDLTSIIIPNSVTSIGSGAFKDCSGLKKVIVSDMSAWCGIKFVDRTANPLAYAMHLYIDENTEIKNLVIPNSVTSIGEYSFCGCSGLTSITIPNSVTSIGKGAFYYCSGLTSVTIGNSVTSIGDVVFYNCASLTSFIIPHSVTSIGNSAFSGCSSLTSITIPNSVTSIGQSAFSGCSGLISITIGNSVTSIGSGAFSGCSGLKKVIVSDIAAWCGIKFVDNPLYYAKHLYSDETTEIKSLVIPNSVTSIGNRAFYGCSGLTSITIPNSVTSIGSGAFSGCSGLKKVIVSDIAAWCGIKFVDNPLYYAKHLYSDENTEIKNLVIPNNVTSISNRAFYGCSGLIYVTIGNGVTSIGSGAFYGADIAKVISLIENPFKIYGESLSDDGTFSLYTFNNATLYVPNGTIDKYKTTNGWKDFRFIKEGSPF